MAVWRTQLHYIAPALPGDRVTIPSAVAADFREFCARPQLAAR